MGEFWSFMAPFLIAAVLLPASIVLSLIIRPSDEWCERVIQEWADSQGLRVAAIDESPWFNRISNDMLYRVFHLKVLDTKGRKRECKAAVGRLLLVRTARNIAITWMKEKEWANDA